MLKKKLIPTPLRIEQADEPEDEPGKPVEIGPLQSHKNRQLIVWFHILRWLMHVLSMKVTGRLTPERNARRLRQLLEQLGFLWIKAGQVLSWREDFFSPELCRELASLHYRARGFSPEIARETIEKELDGPVGKFFEDFEEQPLAVTSISQIHRARLKRERVDVVVKVMRPDVADIFDKDIKVLKVIVNLLNHIPKLASLQLNDGLWELEQIVLEEKDFRYEISNIRRLRKKMRKRKHVYIPKPYSKYSTNQVLVMEMIKGTSMADFLQAHERDPVRAEEWLTENKIKPKKVARRLLRSFMRQLFEDNVFHQDMEAGNVILLRDNRVALLDLGCLGTMERKFLLNYSFLLRAVATKEFQKSADLILMMMPQLPAANLTNLKEDTVRTLRDWDMRSNLKMMPYREKSISNVIVTIVRDSTEYDVWMMWPFLRINQIFGTLDATLDDWMPTANYSKTFRNYFKQRGARAMRQSLNSKALRATITGLPEQISDIGISINPLIRRLGHTFSGQVSKVSNMIAFIFRAAVWAIIAVGVYFLAAFLYQKGITLTGEYPKASWAWILQKWVSKVPELATVEWVLLVILELYLILPFRSLWKKFSEPEARIPFTSASAS